MERRNIPSLAVRASGQHYGEAEGSKPSDPAYWSSEAKSSLSVLSGRGRAFHPRSREDENRLSVLLGQEEMECEVWTATRSEGAARSFLQTTVRSTASGGYGRKGRCHQRSYAGCRGSRSALQRGLSLLRKVLRSSSGFVVAKTLQYVLMVPWKVLEMRVASHLLEGC